MNILIYLGIGLVVLIILIWLSGFRIIGSNQVGIVEKWWSTKGSLQNQLIALNGEAGFQPLVLRGGIVFKTPLMYKIHLVPLVTIPQGKIGYVFARDGEPLEPTQTLGKIVPEAKNFQNIKSFFENGGQRGPQRGIIREGTYAFNLAQFIIITENKTYYLPTGGKNEQDVINQMSQQLNNNKGFTPVIIKGDEDMVAVVTVHDGPSLPKDNIIAPTFGDDSTDPNYHNNFQDIEKFLKAGGFRGRQYQVLADGTYYINRFFATVEMIPKTIIPVGFVGVVVSYTGPKGIDSTGEDYKHGELVENGYRGVWKDPLMPGKYAFNTFAGSIFKIPTTNVILKWISDQIGSHKYDENLKEVSLITKDAFEPSLPLSVVFHIDYRKAPLVIQRFGDIKMLVDQTLDPMVSAYFKNVGQTKTLIELIQQRSDIQNQSSIDMKQRFDHYNIELEEVLIGTPNSSNDNKVEFILTQLRDRQVATEQLETYDKQQKASEKQKELNEAQAIAKMQTNLSESDINIRIQENTGKAELSKARQDAEKIQRLSEAEAYRVKQQAQASAYTIEQQATAEAKRTELLGAAEAYKIQSVGAAEADREARVGISKAIAATEQVKAYGGAQYQIMQDVLKSFADAIKQSKIDIVPKTVILGNSDGDGKIPNAFESLLTLMLTEKLGNITPDNKENSPEIEKIRKELLSKISNSNARELNKDIITPHDIIP